MGSEQDFSEFWDLSENPALAENGESSEHSNPVSCNPTGYINILQIPHPKQTNKKLEVIKESKQTNKQKRKGVRSKARHPQGL